MNDASFAQAVFFDAQKALAEYDLSLEELEKFKALSNVKVDDFLYNSTEEERKSFALIFKQGGWDANHNESIFCNY
jgi:hypothetical protein